MKINKLSLLAAIMVSAAAICFSGCSSEDDSDDDIETIELSSVYGWTYGTSFTASSGNVMQPKITIFNEKRLDWDMSANNGGILQYWYTSEYKGKNVYITWWYSTEAEMYADNKSRAVMIVKIGIQSEDTLKVLASSATAGAGSSMTGTTLTMTKTDAEKTTTPTSVSGQDTELEDVTITVPETAVSAEWVEDSTTFTGSFYWLVSSMSQSGKGRAEVTDSESTSASVTITKTDNNTVSIKSHSFYNTYMLTLYLGPWTIEDVKVMKDGDDYYFYKEKGACTSKTENNCDYTYTALSHGKNWYANSDHSEKDQDYTIYGKEVCAVYKNGTFTFRDVFQPGSMPLDLTSIFTGYKTE